MKYSDWMEKDIDAKDMEFYQKTWAKNGTKYEFMYFIDTNGYISETFNPNYKCRFRISVIEDKDNITPIYEDPQLGSAGCLRIIITFLVVVACVYYNVMYR